MDTNLYNGLNRYDLSSMQETIRKAMESFSASTLNNHDIYKASSLITQSLSGIGNSNSMLKSYDISLIANSVKIIEANLSLFSEKSTFLELFKSLNISSFSEWQKITEANFDNLSAIDDETIRFIEEQEIVLNDEESRILKDMTETLIELFPPLKLFFESIKEKKYHNTVIIFMVMLFFVCLTILPLFNTNDFYKINRDNVRIRETPSKEDKNVIYKLNKNISVIKVDSQNGWVKVRFEMEEGVEKEGWVYGNMLSEIEK